MNDEILLLMTEAPDYKAGVTSEYIQAYKEEKARQVAGKLVAKMMKTNGKKSILFGYWKRIGRAEEQAIIATKLLDSQALALKDIHLYAHWVRVRMSIKERSYQ
jgi:uncharacterized protein (UPF0254 family)